MSDLDTWWATLGDTLVSGLREGSVVDALTTALRQETGTARLGTGAGTVTGELAQLRRANVTAADAKAAHDRQVLDELRLQTQLLAGDRTLNVHVPLVGSNVNEVAQAAMR